ncbi:MAG: sugar ABC transporter ATP-binding protein [Kosmotoga sp.]|nr:MAG: sugar ABC transporter ATP-binding protein [Kosmotoga sp.]
MEKNNILSFVEIDKHFPGVHALKKVSFDVQEGEIHALLGANGAGKSTLIKILARVYQQTSGKITIKGKNIRNATPKNIRDFGIDFIFQELELIPNFSVAQNVLLGNECTKATLIDRKQMFSIAQEVLDQLIPGFINAKAIVKDLTVAQQQLVCIARSLYSKPKILVLDEPTSRLSVSEVDALFTVIDKLKNERGITAVYISHRLEEIYRIADRLTILRDGKNMGTFEVNKIKPGDIVKHMMGEEIDITEKINDLKPEYSVNPVMEVRELSIENCFGPIDFEVYKGEVLCITGAVGSKKTELLETIFGLRKSTSGDIFINGKKWIPKSPLNAKRKGVSLVPEDRRRNGVIYEFSVRKNISLTSLKSMSKMKFIINGKKEKQIAKKLSEDLSIKTPDLETYCKNLSGGNQQKVVFAKWLIQDAQIYLFDEPTVGIDVKGKEEIYKIIHRLAKEGKTVIVTTSDSVEALRISSRILVLFAGQNKGLLESDKTDEKELLYLSMGGKTDDRISFVEK